MSDESAREIIDRLAQRYEIVVPFGGASGGLMTNALVADVLDAATVAVHIWEKDDAAEWSDGPAYDAMLALEKALGRTP